MTTTPTADLATTTANTATREAYRLALATDHARGIAWFGIRRDYHAAALDLAGCCSAPALDGKAPATAYTRTTIAIAARDAATAYARSVVALDLARAAYDRRPAPTADPAVVAATTPHTAAALVGVAEDAALAGGPIEALAVALRVADAVAARCGDPVALAVEALRVAALAAYRARREANDAMWVADLTDATTTAADAREVEALGEVEALALALGEALDRAQRDR